MILHFISYFIFFKKKTFSITGARRSGNHAFVRWLSNALEEDDVSFEQLDFGFSVSASGKTVFFNEMNVRGQANYIFKIIRFLPFIIRADNVIVTTEDHIPHWFDAYSIPSSTKIKVSRSLLNTVCSRLKKAQVRALDGAERGDMMIDHSFMKVVRWINLPHSDWLLWHYDSWVLSKEYRIDFLSSLGLTFNLEPGISIEGGGSSFTGTDTTPTHQEVKERYLQVEITPAVRELLLKDYYKKELDDLELEFLVNTK